MSNIISNNDSNLSIGIEPIFILNRQNDDTLAVSKITSLPQATNATIIFALRTFSGSSGMRNQIASNEFCHILNLRTLVFGKAYILGVSVHLVARTSTEDSKLDPVNHSVLAAHYVHKFEEDKVMTKLINDNIIVVSTSVILRDYLLRGQKIDEEGRICIWCFDYKMNETAATVWMLVIIISSVVFGLIAGFVARDGRLALGIGCALLAVLGAGYKVVMKLYRQRYTYR